MPGDCMPGWRAWTADGSSNLAMGTRRVVEPTGVRFFTPTAVLTRALTVFATAFFTSRRPLARGALVSRLMLFNHRLLKLVTML